jgi:hypothetical protein
LSVDATYITVELIWAFNFGSARVWIIEFQIVEFSMLPLLDSTADRFSKISILVCLGGLCILLLFAGVGFDDSACKARWLA